MKINENEAGDDPFLKNLTIIVRIFIIDFR